MSQQTMIYQPLARRYRPVRFEGPDGLVGQPHVARTLKNAIQQGKIANAYLLAGPRGTGKTTTARILAAALNCEKRSAEAEPCGTCESCRRTISGREVHDIIELDAASNRGVDDARTLRQNAYYAPSTPHGYRVFIIDEAHMLTREAWNALLKILEEPPPRVLFVFCTTEPQKIEQTAPPILSRCQRLDMRRLTHADIAQHLAHVATTEGIRLQDEARYMVARRANGGMRDALSMLDQLRAFQGEAAEITEDIVRSAFGIQPEAVYLRAIDIIANGERAAVFKMVHHLDEQGADFVRFLEELQDVFGSLAYAQEGGVPEGWSENGLLQLMKKAGRELQNGTWAKVNEPKISTRRVVEIMVRCQQALTAVRQAPRPGIVLITLLQQAITDLHEIAQS